MRYNDKIQRLADECARENHHFCASYLGRVGEEFFFATRYSDCEPRCGGLPSFVIVKDMTARFEMSVESFHYLNEVKIRDHKKGLALYHEMERKVKDYDFHH